MKKTFIIFLSALLILSGAHVSHANNENFTLSFENIIDNSHLIPKKAWENANKKFTVKEKNIIVKNIIGPNSISLNKNADQIIKKVSQLYSDTSQPNNVLILNFGYEDRSWASQEGLRILSSNTTFNKNWIDLWACPSKVKCWGAGSYFNKNLNNHLIVIATGVSHQSHFNGNIEAHEFTHNIQQQIMEAETPWPLTSPWPPMWYAEGQANFSAMMVSGKTYEEYLKSREYILNSLLKNKNLTSDYIEQFLSNSYSSSIDDKDFWLQYEIGSAFIEVLNSISGPDSTMDVYELTASGINFEQAFSRVYKINFEKALNIASKAIFNNITEKNKTVLKNTSEQVPTLAILDTALDTSIPEIKSKLIYEVCILDWPSCPNGTSFMEGPGSSVLPASIISNRNFNHGTQMASAAISNNPNMNILFIRIIGNTTRGTRQSTGILTITNALEWVFKNKDKYNIVAVSASQGNQNVLKKTNVNYCPVTATDIMVDRLYSVNIPVFFPSGNDRDRSRINWPACIPNAVAVGGVEVFGLNKPQPSIVSNYDGNLIDIWAEINSTVLLPGGSVGNAYGTSVSNQIAAAKYIAVKTAKPTLTTHQILSLIKSKATPVPNKINQNIFIFNLGETLNG